MKAWWLIPLLLLTGAIASRAQKHDASQPYAAVGVAALDSATNTEWDTWGYAGPAPGRQLIVHVELNGGNGTVFTAAFNHANGKLVPGWLPQSAELSAGETTILPKAPVQWKWEKDEGATDIAVVVLAPGANETTELKKLFTAIGTAKDESLLALQTNKVRELIGRISQAAGVTPTPKGLLNAMGGGDVAGTFRSILSAPPGMSPSESNRPPSWRQLARTANFSASHPASLSFSDAEWESSRHKERP
jgi:hypothetical protein